MIDVPKSRRDDPEFRRISPLGQVPVLVLADGGTMTESAAMCILLAERHPGARLAPAHGAAGRADFLRWMTFMAAVLYQAALRIYYAPRYTSKPAGMSAVKDAALAEFDAGLAIIDRALVGRDWLVRERSLADIYLLMLFHWHPDLDRARAECPNIERTCERLRTDPLLARLNARHGLW